jgi:hypothetical protein
MRNIINAILFLLLTMVAMMAHAEDVMINEKWQGSSNKNYIAVFTINDDFDAFFFGCNKQTCKPAVLTKKKCDFGVIYPAYLYSSTFGTKKVSLSCEKGGDGISALVFFDKDFKNIADAIVNDGNFKIVFLISDASGVF